MAVTGWIARNNYLNTTEMQNNARIVYSYLSPLGWSVNAISALLGNMQAESTINPQLYEGRRVPQVGASDIPWGYGLVQWTPATKMMWWAQDLKLDWANGNVQLSRIEYERQSWRDRYQGLHTGLQWICPHKEYDEDREDWYCTYTFYDWSTSSATPARLAVDFMLNYERPEDQGTAQREKRSRYAEYWYKFLTGGTSGTVIPVPPAGLPNLVFSPFDNAQPRLPLYMLLKPRRR